MQRVKDMISALEQVHSGQPLIDATTSLGSVLRQLTPEDAALLEPVSSLTTLLASKAVAWLRHPDPAQRASAAKARVLAAACSTAARACKVLAIPALGQLTEAARMTGELLRWSGDQGEPWFMVRDDPEEERTVRELKPDRAVRAEQKAPRPPKSR